MTQWPTKHFEQRAPAGRAGRSFDRAEALVEQFADDFRPLYGNGRRLCQGLQESRELSLVDTSRPKSMPGDAIIIPCERPRFEIPPLSITCQKSAPGATAPCA